MSRLADYFVVVGYDQEKERKYRKNRLGWQHGKGVLISFFSAGGGSRGGKILQRFPEKDWPDTPFIDGLEWFCQPLGWKLSTDRQEPQFFTSVLTDIDAQHHYCACLSFNETMKFTPMKRVDDEEEDISDRNTLISSGPAAITHNSVMYAPKCLVIVSKLNYLDTFKVSVRWMGDLIVLIGSNNAILFCRTAWAPSTRCTSKACRITSKVSSGTYSATFRYHRRAADKCGSRSVPAISRCCSHHYPLQFR